MFPSQSGPEGTGTKESCPFPVVRSPSHHPMCLCSWFPDISCSILAKVYTAPIPIVSLLTPTIFSTSLIFRHFLYAPPLLPFSCTCSLLTYASSPPPTQGEESRESTENCVHAWEKGALFVTSLSFATMSLKTWVLLKRRSYFSFFLQLAETLYSVVCFTVTNKY